MLITILFIPSGGKVNYIGLVRYPPARTVDSSSFGKNINGPTIITGTLRVEFSYLFQNSVATNKPVSRYIADV